MLLLLQLVVAILDEVWVELSQVMVAMLNAKLLVVMEMADAGMLGEVSGANTATSTLVYVSTIFKTNTPFLVSSNFIHTCLLAIQQLFSGPTFYMC